MIIDGKSISNEILDNLKTEIENISKENKRIPKLCVVVVGENQASKTYVKNKIKKCKYIGMRYETVAFPTDISEEIVLNSIYDLNNRDDVDGILVQLPLPPHIDEHKIIEAISPQKDVDGFTPTNIAKLFLGEKCLKPCTPNGIIMMLDKINYDLVGKHVVIVGRSNIVGKPLALMCLQRNATVTICHSKTKNLREECLKADVLIVAIGKPKVIGSLYIKKGAIVIDVGINRDEDGKLCGDCDFVSCERAAGAITPVPGGVGPMTVTMLLKNTLEAYHNREKGEI